MTFRQQIQAELATFFEDAYCQREQDLDTEPKNNIVYAKATDRIAALFLALPEMQTEAYIGSGTVGRREADRNSLRYELRKTISLDGRSE